MRCDQMPDQQSDSLQETPEQVFRRELQELINKHSRENVSNTPDFILAQYIDGCLASFDTAVQQREKWYRRDGCPSAT